MGFPRPISLLGGSFCTLAHPDSERTGHSAGNSTTRQNLVSSIGLCAVQAFVPVSSGVFIAFRENGPLRRRRVSPAAAVTDAEMSESFALLEGVSVW
jgi:hypothetical protein